MVGERFRAKRRFTSSMLEMLVRETPVPEDDPTPVFPMDIVRSSDLTEAIEDDVRQAFSDVGSINDTDIEVTKSVSMLRGLGEFKDVEILVNIKGARPDEVNEAVERLVDDGYSFSIVKFV